MENLEARLLRHEGKSLTPYWDTKGLLTIGVGHCIDTNPLPADIADYLKEHGSITESQCAMLLTTDASNARREVLNNMPWADTLSQTRMDVLVELAFWIGINGLLKFKHMISDLRCGNYEDACQDLMQSKLYDEIPKRTGELAQLLLEG